jgi:hypothetical protein
LIFGLGLLLAQIVAKGISAAIHAARGDSHCLPGWSSLR